MGDSYERAMEGYAAMEAERVPGAEPGAPYLVGWLFGNLDAVPQDGAAAPLWVSEEDVVSARVEDAVVEGPRRGKSWAARSALGWAAAGPVGAFLLGGSSAGTRPTREVRTRLVVEYRDAAGEAREASFLGPRDLSPAALLRGRAAGAAAEAEEYARAAGLSREGGADGPR